MTSPSAQCCDSVPRVFSEVLKAFSCVSSVFSSLSRVFPLRPRWCLADVQLQDLRVRFCAPIRRGPHDLLDVGARGEAAREHPADADRALGRVAEKLGLKDSYGSNPVGVYFGESGKTVADKVKIGDMVVLDGPFSEVGDTVVSQCLDNRIGCWAVIRAWCCIMATSPTAPT